MQNWDHEPTDLNHSCLRCGEHRTELYIKNFGKNGDLYACMDCTTHRDVHEGQVGTIELNRYLEDEDLLTRPLEPGELDEAYELLVDEYGYEEEVLDRAVF